MGQHVALNSVDVLTLYNDYGFEVAGKVAYRSNYGGRTFSCFVD